MSTLDNGGYFPFDKEIEHYVQQFNNEYPSYETMKSALLHSFYTVSSFEFDDDSIWYRKSNFFTLLVEVTKNDYGGIALRDKLLAFERDVLNNKHQPKDRNPFSTYYSYMFTGTNSRQARVTRSEILNTFLLQ